MIVARGLGRIKHGLLVSFGYGRKQVVVPPTGERREVFRARSFVLRQVNMNSRTGA